MKTPSVAIIIVHYNSDRFTTECLESLEEMSKVGVKLIVYLIDNASEKPFTFQNKEINLQIIRSEVNTGFAGGNNLGITQALKDGFDYLLLLNSDTTVSSNFLQPLIRLAESEPQAGMISPKIYFEKGYEFHKNSYTAEEKGKVIWYAGGSIDWKNVYSFHRGVDEVDHGQFDLPSENRTDKEIPYYGVHTMDFASGCCVLLPRKVIEAVQGFDESYFLYWEDVDLSERIKRLGYKLYFCPESVIWHKNAGSTGGSGSATQSKYQKKNRVKFALKYASLRSKIAVLKDSFLSNS